MFNELSKSFFGAVKERTTSPFYGVFIVSWLIWNWKVLFTIIFVSEDRLLPLNRIEYIESLLNIRPSLYYPLISTVIIIVLMPIITIPAYWIYLTYERLKRVIKNKVDNKTPLTQEEITAFREERISEGERFTRAIELKDREISQLEKEIETLKIRGVTESKTVATNKVDSNLIFDDDFDYNKGWVLNYWGSTNPSKTNRIQNSMMYFQAQENELTGRIKENGAYIDLRDRISNGSTYEVSCKIKADFNTTMGFQLWVHDTIGGDPNASVREPTDFIVPTQEFETIKLKYTARTSNAMRIHLHTRPGQGQIMVDKIRVVRL
ncbi:MAG: hypothetical protein E6P95_02780 [Candidatus Moraniibacteriota bacterium]|nr:MAG: hypothetical protein E6P95_02780 [Candidatus Moranbacteria bacterium]